MRGNSVMTKRRTLTRNWAGYQLLPLPKACQLQKQLRKLVLVLNGRRPKLMKVLSDPGVGTIIVEHRAR
jgi:hypothetical protein